MISSCAYQPITSTQAPRDALHSRLTHRLRTAERSPAQKLGPRDGSAAASGNRSAGVVHQMSRRVRNGDRFGGRGPFLPRSQAVRTVRNGGPTQRGGNQRARAVGPGLVVRFVAGSRWGGSWQGAAEVANRAHSKVREGAAEGGNAARGRPGAI
jgi:hypothetical protein